MPFHVLHLIPLLAIPILLLLYYTGPLLAAGMTIFATIVGMVGFIFSLETIFTSSGIEEKMVPIIFLIQIVWLWGVFWIAEKLKEMKDLEVHRLQEEAENLEVSGMDYQLKKKELENVCEGIKERILNYSKLRSFTDDLAATLKLSEVKKQTQESVQKFYSDDPESKVQLNLFEHPNQPGKNFVLGDWLVKHRIPLLIADTSQDLRFPDHELEKNASFMASPLERENHIVGSLSVKSEISKKWEDEDLRFLSDISNIVSLSVANAVYYEKVEQLAVKDSLTGLYVRYRFDERIEEEFHRAKAIGCPLSLILFDIDHFKKVNDMWGHQAGDSVLKEVSNIILSQTRETDFCARYGGEEIAVIMPLTDIKNSYQIAERVRKNIEQFLIGDEGIKVTISGGISSVHPDMQTVKDFIETVDQALYQAKDAGRNRLIKAAS